MQRPDVIKFKILIAWIITNLKNQIKENIYFVFNTIEMLRQLNIFLFSFYYLLFLIFIFLYFNPIIMIKIEKKWKIHLKKKHKNCKTHF